MANPQRLRRIGDQIQREISSILAGELRDPRVALVTITEVRVAQDMAHAKVFYTTLSTSTDRAELAQVLERASGFMRSLLGRRIKTHITPELHFEYDQSIEHGLALEQTVARWARGDGDAHDSRLSLAATRGSGGRPSARSPMMFRWI